MAKKGKFDINAISIPTFSVTLLNGKTVKVRAIVMKEYRNLLLAKDGSKDLGDQIDAIEQVVSNAIMDDIDHTELTPYDFEMIFIKAFAFGTGENKIRANFQCTNQVTKTDVDGVESQGPCAALIKGAIEIDKIRPSVDTISNELHKDFAIQDSVSVRLRQPTFNDVSLLTANSAEGVIEGIIRQFESVTVGDVVSDINLISDEDLNELFDRIEPLVIADMFKYVSTIPQVQSTIKMKCPSCSKRYSHTLTGINSFFI